MMLVFFQILACHEGCLCLFKIPAYPSFNGAFRWPDFYILDAWMRDFVKSCSKNTFTIHQVCLATRDGTSCWTCDCTRVAQACRLEASTEGPALNRDTVCVTFKSSSTPRSRPPELVFVKQHTLLDLKCFISLISNSLASLLFSVTVVEDHIITTPRALQCY